LQRIADPVHGRFDIEQKLLERRNAELVKQFFLTCDVIIQGSLLDARGSRYLASGRGGVPLLPKQRSSDIQDPFESPSISLRGVGIRRNRPVQSHEQTTLPVWH